MTTDPSADPIHISEIKPTAASERQSSAWDIRNAPRNYISLVLAQGGSAVFSFGAVWLITRHLGSEGYGGIVAIIAASQVAQVLVNWTCIAVVRFGVDEFIETEKIARTFWVRLIVLVVNFVLVLLLANLWFPPLAGWLKLSPETFWLVLAHFAATTFWIHIQMSLQAAKMPRVQGFLLMLERLLIFAGLFALTAAAILTPYWAMLCYIIAPTIMIAFGLFEIRHFVTAKFDIDRVFLKKIFAYSLPLLPMSVVGYFSTGYLDAIFLSNFLSIRDLGIYSVASQINGLTLQLPTLANSLLIPLFITLEKEDQSERTGRFFKDVLPSSVFLWGFLCTGTAFTLYFLIPFVFGPEFNAAVFPLWILLAGSCAGLPVLIGYSALSHTISATRISLYAATFAAIINFAFNILLIPKFGLIGCAWATVLSFFMCSVIYAVLLKKSKRISFSWILLAMMPALLGAVSLSINGDSVLSLMTFTIVALPIIYWQSNSIRRTFSFIKNLT